MKVNERVVESGVIGRSLRGVKYRPINDVCVDHKCGNKFEREDETYRKMGRVDRFEVDWRF